MSIRYDICTLSVNTTWIQPTYLFIYLLFYHFSDVNDRHDLEPLLIDHVGANGICNGSTDGHGVDYCCPASPTTVPAKTARSNSSESTVRPPRTARQRQRTTSMSQKTSNPSESIIRANNRTIYTAGRPPWYNCAGQQVEPFVIGKFSLYLFANKTSNIEKGFANLVHSKLLQRTNLQILIIIQSSLVKFTLVYL